MTALENMVSWTFTSARSREVPCAFETYEAPIASLGVGSISDRVLDEIARAVWVKRRETSIGGRWAFRPSGERHVDLVAWDRYGVANRFRVGRVRLLLWAWVRLEPRVESDDENRRRLDRVGRRAEASRLAFALSLVAVRKAADRLAEVSA